MRLPYGWHTINRDRAETPWLQTVIEVPIHFGGGFFVGHKDGDTK